MKRKALLIPYNSKREIYIQDRKGHKPPPWGFFGGTIENGETSISAIIRETKEEIDLTITSDDLIYLGPLHTVYDGEEVERFFYLLKTDQKEFNVLEGAGGHWMSFKESEKFLIPEDKLFDLQKKIEKYEL